MMLVRWGADARVGQGPGRPIGVRAPVPLAVFDQVIDALLVADFIRPVDPALVVQPENPLEDVHPVAFEARRGEVIQLGRLSIEQREQLGQRRGRLLDLDRGFNSLGHSARSVHGYPPRGS